ncbi:hypothetical protein BH24DEI1_BH24DEI1_18260 [soil metagenome]|jgi:hypothetical protein
MLLSVGEKIHIVTRLLFENDVRRHFVGEVEAATESIARIRGYAFVFEFDSNMYRFVRRPELRVRLVSLADGNNVINIIPREVDLEDLQYEDLQYDSSPGKTKHVVITDGKSFSLDVHEFSRKL